MLDMVLIMPRGRGGGGGGIRGGDICACLGGVFVVIILLVGAGRSGIG